MFQSLFMLESAETLMMLPSAWIKYTARRPDRDGAYYADCHRLLVATLPLTVA